jgi:hypothetical protein
MGIAMPARIREGWLLGGASSIIGTTFRRGVECGQASPGTSTERGDR